LKLPGQLILLRKPEGKRLIRRQEDYIRMVIREISWVGVNWIYVAEDSNQWWALSELGNELFRSHKRQGIS